MVFEYLERIPGDERFAVRMGIAFLDPLSGKKRPNALTKAIPSNSPIH
jgi:hypothetical protein